ncbi:hypothetical protein ERJ75_000502100 [Trypanosoma vivax]|nr:hypothetical protein ERJ75_000502100 [Trypanosoma vivax]
MAEWKNVNKASASFSHADTQYTESSGGGVASDVSDSFVTVHDAMKKMEKRDESKTNDAFSVASHVDDTAWSFMPSCGLEQADASAHRRVVPNASGRLGGA